MKQKRTPAYGPRRPRRNRMPALVILVLSVVLSLAIGGVWQLMDPVPYDPLAFAGPPGGQRQPDPPPGEQGQSRGEAPSSSHPDSSGSSQEPSTPESTPNPGFEPLVPQGEWLPSTYFDDALFVGDSITEGIKLYEVMSNAKVLASTGVNLDTIYTKLSQDTPQGKVSIVDAAALESPGKIYLLMGVNSLLSSQEVFIKNYGRLVDTLKGQHPGATLYVQSILPVTAAYEAKAGAVTTNEEIARYNQALLELCREKEVYYLDVAAAFRDQTGALPDEASPRDGIHFGRSWYMKWFDYLRTHGAPAAEF